MQIERGVKLTHSHDTCSISCQDSHQTKKKKKKDVTKGFDYTTIVDQVQNSMESGVLMSKHSLLASTIRPNCIIETYCKSEVSRSFIGVKSDRLGRHCI